MTKDSKKGRGIYLLLIFFIGIFLLSFSLGRYPIDPITLLKILFSRIITINKTWTDVMETVVFEIRLPRILGAVLVGAALSVSGVVYQSMFKNPLVSPDILGVSAGAAFGAALAIFFSFSSLGIQLSAFAFGLAGVALVYLISLRIKGDPITSLVIMGILVGSIFSSLTSLIKYLADTDSKLPAITFWLMGSLSGVNFKALSKVLLPMAVAFIPLYLLRWRLNVLSLSEEEAKSLGLDTRKLRALVILCSSLLTASAVSISGVIGWIGLVIPHVARMLVGSDHKVLLPASMLLGASYLLLVDNISRALTTVELPLGILTALIGAPFFIFLMLQKERF
ncbi:MAG: iron ABC transporter permease [Tissierellia bacterium]|nr:iron ABC transporter permease [Tissierellia bacterium]